MTWRLALAEAIRRFEAEHGRHPTVIEHRTLIASVRAQVSTEAPVDIGGYFDRLETAETIDARLLLAARMGAAYLRAALAGQNPEDCEVPGSVALTHIDRLIDEAEYAPMRSHRVGGYPICQR